MWPEAAASNESAWASSEAWMKRKNLSPSVRDYHSLHWLLYVYLQQGRYRKADELLSLMKKTMTETTYDNKLRPGYYENNYANMAAAFIVETERWDLAASLFPAGARATASSSSGGHGAHGAAPPKGQQVLARTSNEGERLPVFIRAMAAAMKNTAVEEPASSIGNGSAAGPPGISELEVKALAASIKGEHEKAIQFMTEAAAMEEQKGAPSGPPAIIKPAHELFGEILLRAGKYDRAAEQFKTALLRQPNRARSLLGLARVQVKKGNNTEAATVYARLLEQWKDADQDLAELKEANDFLRSTKPTK